MVRLEHHETPDGRVAVVLLDRHEKRNALTPDMLENIRACADHVHAEEDHPGALVLGGVGDVFCAGFDLSLCQEDPLILPALLTRLSETARALRHLPIPVVAAAQGGAIAGGCALLCGADFVITNRDARLGYPVVRIGVSPAVSSTLLQPAIGHAHCRERLLDPALIDGEEALRIGLASECLAKPDAVLPRALELATDLASKQRHALAATKRWLNELDGSENAAQLDGALNASLAITSGDEQRTMLESVWRG